MLQQRVMTLEADTSIKGWVCGNLLCALAVAAGRLQVGMSQAFASQLRFAIIAASKSSTNSHTVLMQVSIIL